MKGTFTVFPNLYNYTDDAYPDAVKRLSNLGLSFRQGSFGGGPEEIKEIIVAWISLHPIWSSLISNVLGSLVFKILESLFVWNFKKKIRDDKTIPKLNVTIYHKSTSKINLSFRIDKKYTKSEVRNLIESAISNVFDIIKK